MGLDHGSWLWVLVMGPDHGSAPLWQVAPKKVGAAGSKVDDYWEPGKKMLQDAKGLLDSMFQFDKDNIPLKVIEKLKPYIDNEEFTPKKIESASKACTAMCQWVR